MNNLKKKSFLYFEKFGGGSIYSAKADSYREI